MKKIICACISTLAMTSALAWPDKQVTLVVPFPPGGSSDLIARTVGNKLQEKFGKPFIVENKGGAGGAVGTTVVKKAAADGNTLLVTSLGPLVIGPHLIKSAGYNALKDFDYITVAVQAPNVLAVPASSPFKTLADVVAYQKANPGMLTYASSGIGSSDHLTAELFWQVTKSKGLHVPYKGGGLAMTDLLGEKVQATFMNLNTGLANIKAGKLRALAVTSSKRSPLLPDVPSLEELGIKGVTVNSWQAFAAPKGIPANIKATLHAAIIEALNDPTVKPKLLELGFEIVGNSPKEFTAFQATEFARWKKVIQLGKIEAE